MLIFSVYCFPAGTFRSKNVCTDRECKVIDMTLCIDNTCVWCTMNCTSVDNTQRVFIDTEILKFSLKTLAYMYVWLVCIYVGNIAPKQNYNIGAANWQDRLKLCHNSSFRRCHNRSVVDRFLVDELSTGKQRQLIATPRQST